MKKYYLLLLFLTFIFAILSEDYINRIKEEEISIFYDGVFAGCIVAFINTGSNTDTELQYIDTLCINFTKTARDKDLYNIFKESEITPIPVFTPQGERTDF